MGVKIKKVNHALSAATAHAVMKLCVKSQEQSKCAAAAPKNKRNVGQATEGKGPVTLNTFIELRAVC